MHSVKVTHALFDVAKKRLAAATVLAGAELSFAAGQALKRIKSPELHVQPALSSKKTRG
jgi:hypothetical protein